MEEKSASLETSIYLQQCFFGSMYIVEDQILNTRYLKQVISQEELDQMDSDLQMQFKHFKDHLNNCGPHELSVVEIQESDAGTSIYFEYCNGLSLYDRLGRFGQGFSISDAFSTIKSILAYYLYYEDKGGVYHRDVKLENFFIDHLSQVKIGGQDLALFGGVKQRSIGGCASYLAPEVFSAIRQLCCDHTLQSHNITTKADIFSLGILTLELLTGHSFHLSKRNQKSGKEPKNFLEYIHQVEDIQQMAQKALESISLKSLHANFYTVIKSMLEPVPETRCNFPYLYEFFGLRHQIKSLETVFSNQQSNSSAFGDKVSLLCDPIILQLAEIRKLFFMRVDHEFCLVQFLIYGSKEVWELSNFNFGTEYFDENLRKEFKVIACCLALRAMIYLDNLRSTIRMGANLFNIRQFDKYTAHAIYRTDVEYIMRKIQIEDSCPVKLYFAVILAQIEDQISSHLVSFDRLKVYLQPQVTRSEKLYSLGEAAKQSIKAIVSHQSLEVLQILFEKFLRLIEDCFQEDSRFRFRQPGQGVFNWKEFIAERYPHLENKVIFRRVNLPR